MSLESELAAQICENVAEQSNNSLFRSAAKICAHEIRRSPLTAAMIGRAWRDCGASGNTPPDWALQFAQNIAREILTVTKEITQ